MDGSPSTAVPPGWGARESRPAYIRYMWGTIARWVKRKIVKYSYMHKNAGDRHAWYGNVA
jgi:hypothetical protein